MGGRYLYKYVSFDTEMLVLNIVSKYSIKFSAPSAFNDPFDCNPFYRSCESPQKERRDLFKFVDSLHRSPADKMRARQQAVNRTNLAFESGAFQRNSMATVGVLSLSRTPWHVLMWSHYAEKHTGFVVEFREPQEFAAGVDGTDPRWLVTFPVNYVTDRPVIDRWNELAHGDIESTFMAKSVEWKYEQEERVINYRQGPGVYCYEPSLIKSVIAGCNISDENFAILSAAVKEANKDREVKIDLYRAKIDPRKYQLNIPGFKRERPLT